ncbi:MAG: RidA family protein [Solobacterium sp.]|nr:RidA family protein [Solobacterium sp.]
MTKVIASPFCPRSEEPASPALQNGDFVFISGIYSSKSTLEEQLQECIKQIKSLLREANHSLKDIVRLTYYVKNEEDLIEIDDLLYDYFEAPYPTRSIVFVDGLKEDAKICLDVDSYHLNQRCSNCSGCSKREIDNE